MINLQISIVSINKVRRGLIQADDYDAASQDIKEAERSLNRYEWLRVIPSPDNPPIPKEHKSILNGAVRIL